MKIIFHEKCLEFGRPGHPESSQRVARAKRYLQDRYDIIRPEAATEEEVGLVHTKRLIKVLKDLDFYNPDCPRYPDIYDYAMLAVGGAQLARSKEGFSLMRPPGHHAGKDFIGGFCYLNNLAVAVKWSGKKTLIVDFDVHHGNGTQDIFFKDDQVTYLSIHKTPLYPGTGKISEANCLNFPVKKIKGTDEYLQIFDQALQKVNLEGMEQVAVSAGFDTYEKDPLVSLNLSFEAFRLIGERIKDIGLPTFSVLEGGYSESDLGRCIQEYLQGLGS